MNKKKRLANKKHRKTKARLKTLRKISLLKVKKKIKPVVKPVEVSEEKIQKTEEIKKTPIKESTTKKKKTAAKKTTKKKTTKKKTTSKKEK
tara:strand:+ start:692 stop:964 length:273 start_codon:yes stop_codon:yes gene_type:complete